MQASLIAVAAALSLVAAGALAQPAKPAPKKAAAHNAHKSGKHGLARSAQKAVEEVTPIDDEPGLQLGQAELDVAKLEKVVQVAFSQRRKLLRHTLGRWLEEAEFAGQFDTQRRAEEVPVAEYVALTQAVAKASAPKVD